MVLQIEGYADVKRSKRPKHTASPNRENVTPHKSVANLLDHAGAHLLTQRSVLVTMNLRVCFV
jgi:hypothetical protein